MVPSGLLLISWRTGREDAATRLLRDYVRWEYRGDREWFLTRLSRAPRRRPLDRLRAWLRRTLLREVLPGALRERRTLGFRLTNGDR